MDPNETCVEELLRGYGLRTERFSKDEMRLGRTPDFKVFNEDRFKFYCEVKTIDYDKWLDNKLSEVPSGVIAGGLRPDPVFNRIVDDIHTAIKQFDAVNPNLLFPNVLAIVNHDSICGIHDLWSVLTGCFIGEGGKADYIYPQYSEGKIREEKQRIHLYIWVDKHEKPKYVFNQFGKKIYELDLCSCFGIDPLLIRKIGV